MFGTVYCDFDGTLIQGDIEREWVSFLRRKHYLTFQNYLAACISLPINLFMRLLDRSSLLKAWTVGIGDEEIIRLFPEFYIASGDKLQINPNVLEFIQIHSEENRIVILTGSDTRLIKQFLGIVELPVIIDEIIGSAVKPGGLWVSQHPYGVCKRKYITDNNKSIGIANETADRHYLKICDEAYVVAATADNGLIALANKMNWRLI